MKTMVKALVVLAVVVLLSGSAFAGGPPWMCYNVTASDLDNPEDSCTRLLVIWPYFAGPWTGLFAPPVPGNSHPPMPPFIMFASMFFDSMNQQMMGGSGFDSIHLKFHGDMGHVFNGELHSFFARFCGYSGPHWYALRGMQQEECGEETVAGMETLLNNMATQLNSLGETLYPQE